MTVNGRPEKREPISFRHYRSRRLMLEAIQHERGHADLGETLREAVDEYIERYLRRPKGKAA